MAEEYLIGTFKVIAGLDRIRNSLPFQVGRALYREAQIEMTEAKKRTPVDTGALRASGSVAQPVRSGNETTVTLSFGGPAAKYAVYVHENLEALHPIGQAKFLESVLLESAPHMGNRIARRINDAINEAAR